ncbi:MAG TPA: M48 family metalloprotease, partial [Methylomirabilota bacterium]|nr:M48 family metalloprotease [Methylomirabilota bacterium]
MPLLITSGIWTGPADGCAAALGILPSPAINLSVGPNPQCKFSLVITETAYNTLSHDELRAALAHEIGHVQLGHFAARKERRVAEKKARDEISEKSTTAGAAVTAIPIIGPILA